MSTTTEKILKRRCCPVTINGEQFHIRGLSIGDRRRLDQIPDTVAKSFYTIGRGLVEPNGEQSYPQRADETDADYAARVESTLLEMCSDTFAELTQEINRVGRVPKQETLQKN